MLKSTVQNCSIEQMIQALEKLAQAQFREGSWLSQGNRYKANVISALNADRENGHGVVSSDLREYTAVSAILHCTDGWTFLSNAIKSILAGDVPSAIFFTYYSELRALMSIFGTNGISILDKAHYYFGTDGEAVLTRGGGTHLMVRKILEEYTNNPSKASLLLNWFQIGNHSLEDWLRATGYQTGYVMADFLANWGIDLKEIKVDHDARNNVSYRPHNLDLKTYKYSYKSNLQQVVDIWKLCEPIGSGFSLLDLHILKRSLKKTFDALPYGDNLSNVDRAGEQSYNEDFKKYVENVNKRLGSPLLNSQLMRLTTFDTPIDQFLSYANRPAYDEETNQYDITPMLARAVYLLRFSTAGVKYVFTNANLSKNELAFWWKEYGNKYGFWDENELPDDFIDSLWPDIEEVLNGIHDQTSEGNNNFNNPRSINDYTLQEINCLTQLNKIPLWGFGL